MMDDPLGLRTIPTPVPTRAEQVAPPPQVTNLIRRISGNPGADSLETRITLLTHLVYLTYIDLKEHLVE
jgi:hypothetical protein